jgi:hypothetical protein
VAGAINNSVTTFSITSGTGWPTGTNGPFVATIDRGLATEEKVLVTARSGVSLTGVTRGHDGSSAQAHSNLAVIEHTLSAAMLDEANRVVNEIQGNKSYAAGTTTAIANKVAAEGTARFIVDASGKLTWGPGSGAVDIQLARLSADILELQDQLRQLRASGTDLTQSSRVGAEGNDRFNRDAAGKMQWGPGSGAVDTNLFRDSANLLRTNDALTIDGALVGAGAAFSGVLTSLNVKRGSGSPEGAVVGAIGDIYERTDGGGGTSLYVKESGAGNTGWVAVGASYLKTVAADFVDHSVSSLVADTELVTTTVPAGLCVTGDVLRVLAWGTCSKTGSLSGSYILKLKIGTTLLMAHNPIAIGAGATGRWRCEFHIGFVSQSSQRVNGHQNSSNGNAQDMVTATDTKFGAGTAAENFATSKTVGLAATLTASDGTPTITASGLHVLRSPL